jgi:hypothetical protein
MGTSATHATSGPQFDPTVVDADQCRVLPSPRLFAGISDGGLRMVAAWFVVGVFTVFAAAVAYADIAEHFGKKKK